MKHCTRILDLNRYSKTALSKIEAGVVMGGFSLFLPENGGRYAIISGDRADADHIDWLIGDATQDLNNSYRADQAGDTDDDI